MRNMIVAVILMTAFIHTASAQDAAQLQFMQFQQWEAARQAQYERDMRIVNPPIYQQRRYVPNGAWVCYICNNSDDD